MNDARAAASGAATVHVVGSTGQASIDLTLVNGRGATGSMTQNGASFRLVRIADVVYIQATPQFYVQHGASPAAAQLLKGKWLKASASRPDLAAFVTLTDPSQLFPRLLTPKGTPTKGGETTVGGAKAISLVDRANGGQLDVSLVGKPYPLRLSGHGAHFTFGEWNKQAALKAPAGAIDTSKLG